MQDSTDGITFHRLDLRNECQAKFVNGTFTASLRDSSGESQSYTSQVKQAYHSLLDASKRPGFEGVIATPETDSDQFLGWAAANEWCFVFCYVRALYRKGALGVHLGREMIGRVVPSGGALVMPVWTWSASRAAAQGYPVRYDLDVRDRFFKTGRR